jgi:hypothetical protein
MRRSRSRGSLGVACLRTHRARWSRSWSGSGVPSDSGGAAATPAGRRHLVASFVECALVLLGDDFGGHGRVAQPHRARWLRPRGKICHAARHPGRSGRGLRVRSLPRSRATPVGELPLRGIPRQSRSVPCLGSLPQSRGNPGRGSPRHEIVTARCRRRRNGSAPRAGGSAWPARHMDRFGPKVVVRGSDEISVGATQGADPFLGDAGRAAEDSVVRPGG